MKKLRVASCQFPVTGDIHRNARYVRRYLDRAADAGADLLHTSEARLSGYAGADFDQHSFYNARDTGPNCLDILNHRQVPTRCADNLMWAIANNSSHPYSHWASFVARPDATIAQKLKINQAGMLIHDFPDGLSQGGWLHNQIPMKLAKGEVLTYGKPSRHARQANGRAQP